MANNFRLACNRLLSLTNMYLVFEPPLNDRKQSISTSFGRRINFSYVSLHWEPLWHHNGDGDAEFPREKKILKKVFCHCLYELGVIFFFCPARRAGTTLLQGPSLIHNG